MALYKRAKGRAQAYEKLQGRSGDNIPTIANAPKNRQRATEAAYKLHRPGLGRIRIAYAKKIAKVRNDDFYEGIVVLKGV